ncbi:hypothetical protein [Polycladomyces subterraneus]
MTAAGAYADEAALFPESFVNQMLGRCSVPGAKIWMNCNPQGPRHFIKTDFIDQIDNPQKSICRIHFLLEDNPTLTKETIDFYKGQYQGKRNILGLYCPLCEQSHSANRVKIGRLSVRLMTEGMLYSC